MLHFLQTTNSWIIRWISSSEGGFGLNLSSYRAAFRNDEFLHLVFVLFIFVANSAKGVVLAFHAIVSELIHLDSFYAVLGVKNCKLLSQYHQMEFCSCFGLFSSNALMSLWD